MIKFISSPIWLIWLSIYSTCIFLHEHGKAIFEYSVKKKKKV